MIYARFGTSAKPQNRIMRDYGAYDGIWVECELTFRDGGKDTRDIKLSDLKADGGFREIDLVLTSLNPEWGEI